MSDPYVRVVTESRNGRKIVSSYHDPLAAHRDLETEELSTAWLQESDVLQSAGVPQPVGIPQPSGGNLMEALASEPMNLLAFTGGQLEDRQEGELPTEGLEFVRHTELSGIKKWDFQQKVQGLPVLDAGVSITYFQPSWGLAGAQSTFDVEAADAESSGGLEIDQSDLLTFKEGTIQEKLKQYGFPFEPKKIYLVGEGPAWRRFPTPQENLLNDYELSRMSPEYQQLRRDLSNFLKGVQVNDGLRPVYVIRVVPQGLKRCIEVEIDAETGVPVRVLDRARFHGEDFSGRAQGKAFMLSPFHAAYSQVIRNQKTVSSKVAIAEAERRVTPRTPIDGRIGVVNLNELTTEISLERLRKPGAGKPLELDGRHCKIAPWGQENPEPAPQSDNGKFDFSAADDEPSLLAVMAYYWADLFQEHVRTTLGMKIPARRVAIDPWSDNASQFLPPCSDHEPFPGGAVSLEKKGRPDAADASVIIHEVAHAVQEAQGFTGPRDLEEGWADAAAAVFLDRFHPEGLDRSRLFRYDSLGGGGVERRISASLEYQSLPLETGDTYGRIRFWSSLVWEIFLALGGASKDPAIRLKAADLILKLHLDANSLYSRTHAASSEPLKDHQKMAESLELAGTASGLLPDWPRGVYYKLIRSICSSDWLLPAIKLDLFIKDGRKGAYTYREPKDSSRGPGMMVQRLSGDGSDKSEDPENRGLWIHVGRSTGEVDPERVTLKIFRCDDENSLWEDRSEVASFEFAWPGGGGAHQIGDGVTLLQEISSEISVGPIPFRASEGFLIAQVSSPEDPALSTPFRDPISCTQMQALDNNTAWIRIQAE